MGLSRILCGARISVGIGVIVLSTIGLAKAIIAVSALGFLGFGVQPPRSRMGHPAYGGQGVYLKRPHLSLYPGLAIILTALAVNLPGDAIRDRKAATQA